MFLHQQLQDIMLDEEVVGFGQRAQHQQDQQQLQLRQHNIPHNPVFPKQVMSPNRPNVEPPNQGGPPGPEALYQQNNLLQQIVHLEWDQGLREIVQDNNSSIDQIIAEVRRINQAMGQITGGLNNAFGQVRTDAQNQRQGMASFHEQLVDVHRKLGILEKEATRLNQAEIAGLKERCKKIEHESENGQVSMNNCRKFLNWSVNCALPIRKLRIWSKNWPNVTVPPEQILNNLWKRWH